MLVLNEMPDASDSSSSASDTQVPEQTATDRQQADQGRKTRRYPQHQPPKGEGRNRLKQQADPEGTFIDVSYPDTTYLTETLGHFFWHKQHEWVVLAFLTSEGETRCLWINKGEDRHTATVGLGPSEIAEKSKEVGADQVFLAHNHITSEKDVPRTGSARLDNAIRNTYGEAQRTPSDADKSVLEHYRTFLNEEEISFWAIVYSQQRQEWDYTHAPDSWRSNPGCAAALLPFFSILVG